MPMAILQDVAPRAVAHDDFDGWVEQLADPIRAKRAYWHLVLSGPRSRPSVRAGLQHPQADVRRYCTRVLDRLADESSFGDLVRMLGDPDHRVRLDALHALACNRCKEGPSRPDKKDVLRPALAILRFDPNKQVRAMAVEVVGGWAHRDRAAAQALMDARDKDPEPSVRKKAKWYAPGGTIYRKTARARPAA